MSRIICHFHAMFLYKMDTKMHGYGRHSSHNPNLLRKSNWFIYVVAKNTTHQQKELQWAHCVAYQYHTRLANSCTLNQVTPQTQLEGEHILFWRDTGPVFLHQTASIFTIFVARPGFHVGSRIEIHIQLFQNKQWYLGIVAFLYNLVAFLYNLVAFLYNLNCDILYSVLRIWIFHTT